MTKLPIGIQVYSVREDAEKDFAATMQKLSQMGYEGVELAGLYGLAPEQVRQILADNNLVCISSHVPWAELTADLAGSLAKYKALGLKYIVVPYLDEELRPGQPGFYDVVSQIPAIGQACQAEGLTLLYHNHDFEFVRLASGEFGLDYLYESVPADLLQTELDTCWIKVAGQSPVAYLEKYAGRCPLVHFKDFYMEGDTSDEQLYELIGIEDKKPSRPSSFEFRPVGHGLQDIPAILEATVAADAKWIIVEQDSSVGRTPLEAARLSIDYLHSLG